MDMSYAQTENYLAESPARLSEETVQSLYADEQPTKRIKLITEHPKLAETVGIENTIMLNHEDLAKVAARNMNEDFNKNFGVHTRQTGTFGGLRQKPGRRQAYETTEGKDIVIPSSSPETRTSVIRGVLSNRQQNTSENETTKEQEVDSTEYSNLRCYEQVESDNGEHFGRNRHYLPNSVMETYSTQSDNASHISQKFSRPPISSNRAYQMSGIETRSQPYFAQQMRDAVYRVQHPPEYALSQMDARGKQYFERTGMRPGSAMSFGALNSKYNIQDGLFVQNHTEMQSGYPGYAIYEGRSPVSNENLAKNNNLVAEQDALKPNARNNPSPVSKNIEDETLMRHSSLEQEIVNQGKPNERTDAKHLDDNKNIKGKRGVGTKADNNIQCTQCLKKFGSSSALAKHKATHSDERKYICSICEKGFKRQDHLNGHMMTHRDKKPYECKYCDKSYCDHRSLKRHYENYHPERPVTTTTAASHKTDAEILRTAKSEGRFTPDRDEGRPSPLSSKQEVPQAGFGRKRNSDSMCSNSSDDLSRRPDSHSPHVPFDKSHTAVSMLKQVIDSHEHKKDKQHPLEGYPRSGYYPYPEGIPHPQWFNPFHQAQMMKLMQFNQPPILVQHGTLMNSSYCPTDPPQLVPNYPPMNQGGQEEGGGRKGDDSGYKREKDYVVPTDPTSIAIANAKDEQSGDRLRQTSVKDGGAGGFPHAVKWKTITVEDNGMPPHSMGNNSAIMQLPPGMMVSDHNIKRERPVELNIHIPSSKSEKRPHEMVTTTEHQAKRHCPPPPSPASLHMAQEGLLKLADVSIKSEQPGNRDNVFKNPPSTPPRKPRPRPEPINIPGLNQFGGPLSPPIYTPPPMLSPLSIFHTPRLGGSTPITPGRFFLSGNRSRKNSIDDESLEGPTDVIIPEPKINIGPGFQAEVPSTVEPLQDAMYDKHRAAVCWTPFEHETRKRAQEIEAFLDMACSVAVFGGGSNKEYALHVLYRLKGNIKLAVKHILANKSAIQKEDGLADYHYEGSDRWTSKERLKFREALDKRGKDFYGISKEIKTKNVQQCVEFYYLWKACRPEGMRSRRGYAQETESEQGPEDDCSDEDSETTLIFLCDFPECNSKFISRQALNGHIRVHGGSFMKPEPKRTKVKTTVSSDSSSSNVSVTTNVSRAVTKPPRPAKPPPAPPVLNGDGTLPEFPCKVCGRIFNKIKSRSAHMKTHVKRSDDDVKSKS